MPARSKASQASPAAAAAAGPSPGLARADPEELRVELGGVVQEPALAGVRGAGPVRVRVVERLEVPAPVGREPGDARRGPRPAAPTGPRGCGRRRGSGSSSPTIAIGSSSSAAAPAVARACAVTATAASEPRSSSRRYAAARWASGSRRPAWRAAAARWRRRAGCAARPRSASRSRGPGRPVRPRPRPASHGRGPRRPRGRGRAAADRARPRPAGQPLHQRRAVGRGARLGGAAGRSAAHQAAQQRRHHRDGRARERRQVELHGHQERVAHLLGGVEQRQALVRGQRASTPERLIRDLSVASRSPVMPLASAHRPQAREVAGRPWAWRWRASASRKALAAA
jgi:hypothetical protein